MRRTIVPRLIKPLTTATSINTLRAIPVTSRSGHSYMAWCPIPTATTALSAASTITTGRKGNPLPASSSGSRTASASAGCKILPGVRWMDSLFYPENSFRYKRAGRDRKWRKRREVTASMNGTEAGASLRLLFLIARRSRGKWIANPTPCFPEAGLKISNGSVKAGEVVYHCSGRLDQGHFVR